MSKVVELAAFGITAIGICAFLGLLVGYPIMWLWNWLMPVLFDLPTIGFWQAIGLYLLSGILFRSISTIKRFMLLWHKLNKICDKINSCSRSCLISGISS